MAVTVRPALDKRLLFDAFPEPKSHVLAGPVAVGCKRAGGANHQRDSVFGGRHEDESTDRNVTLRADTDELCDIPQRGD